MLQSYTPKLERNRRKPTPNVAIEPFKVNIAGACALTGLSESAIRRAIKAGTFPAPEDILGCKLFDVPKLKDWAGASARPKNDSPTRARRRIRKAQDTATPILTG